MLKVTANVFSIPIRVIVNSGTSTKGDRWARIKCAKSGKVLHTGRIAYIRRVAKQRYNVDASL
jgi:hypothetical protein